MVENKKGYVRTEQLSFNIINNKIFVSEYIDSFTDVAYSFACFDINNLSFKSIGNNIVFKNDGSNASREFRNVDEDSALVFVNRLFNAMVDAQNDFSMSIS